MAGLKVASPGEVELRERACACLRELGLDPGLIAARGLPLFADAETLKVAEVSADGRPHKLLPAAAEAWRAMKSAAADDGIGIEIVSAFRSFDYQRGLIERKCRRGLGAEEIFRVSAPPGCSEHHSGRAVDIGTAGAEPLSEAFEHTPAFAWLSRRAGEFGFRMSFARDNPWGYAYEPWHWCWHGARA